MWIRDTKVQRIGLMVSGLILLIVSCIPFCAPAATELRMAGAGLFGWGMRAPGHEG